MRLRGDRRAGRIIRVAIGTLSCFLTLGCTLNEDRSLPPQAIFHPGGAQALHASQVDPAELALRESVYVPVYSNIHWSGLSTATELAATISVRNADAERRLLLVSVTYYDSLGQPIQEYLDGIMELDPMSTVEFVVEKSDRRGGSGAHFLVEWGSIGPIAEPVMEAIMLGQIGNAGISFVSAGRPVRILEPAAPR